MWRKLPSLLLAALSVLAPAGQAAASPGKAARPGAPADDGWSLTGAARRAFAGVRVPEFVEMLVAIAGGSDLMGPGDGWFHAGQSRYGWTWLAERMDANGDGKVERGEFRGPAALFDRLDRNGDGVLTAADFDWSTPAKAGPPSDLWFYLLDKNSNGRVSKAEWEAFFARASRGKGYLTPDDLREALQPPRPEGKAAAGPAGPSPLALFKGLLTGELGSPFEGPRLGQRAPDFALKTFDGKRTFRLSEFRGKRPVVLIFGSFT
jgi:hypothetical protein